MAQSGDMDVEIKMTGKINNVDDVSSALKKGGGSGSAPGALRPDHTGSCADGTCNCHLTPARANPAMGRPAG